MKILAIETSCDETSVAIIDTSGRGRRLHIQMRAHVVSSQIKLHAKFGGVVPNLARREHQRLLVPLLLQAIRESRIFTIGGSAYGGTNHLADRDQRARQELKEKKTFSSQDSLFIILDSILEREPELLAQFKKKIIPLAIPDIDAIAVTNGPGLAPALWVGINFAKALAYIWQKPLIPMNHMKGHLFSAFLCKEGKNDNEFQIPQFKFPLLALLVSGGHTELILMKKFNRYTIIGETLDDAVGEAFDKVARMLDLGYPGGPAIATAAAQENKRQQGPDSRQKVKNVRFPRPMIKSKDYNFSFSGLKTSVLYFIRDLPNKKSVRMHTPAIAKEFQDAAVDVLVAKTMRAAREYHAKVIAVGGGVAANELLRTRLLKEIKMMKNIPLFFPDKKLTGDNALMIAVAAAIDGKKIASKDIEAEANMRL